MTTLVYDPGGVGFRIERLWAFLSIHKDGDEGLIALNGMPCIAADETRLVRLRPQVEDIVRETQGHPWAKPIMLARFDRRTDFGIVLP